MRAILLGPFGSMGILNMKLRIMCMEDMVLEIFFGCLALIRIVTSSAPYEIWGAMASVIASFFIGLVTTILVCDGGLQCFCCRSKPIGGSLCGNGFFSRIISDKELIDMLNVTNQIGIAMSLITVISEMLTFFDNEEKQKAAMKFPDHIDTLHLHEYYTEMHNAVVMICIQFFITIPWRVFACRVTRGVLDAIEIVELLKFKTSYSSDALRVLLPETGITNGVSLAHESDIPRIAELYCESFRDLFQHIGLDPEAGPEIIESLWRTRGRTALLRWLNRVGVIRNDEGVIVAMLSLQLPGDMAAYDNYVDIHDNNIYSSLEEGSTSGASASPSLLSDDELPCSNSSNNLILYQHYSQRISTIRTTSPTSASTSSSTTLDHSSSSMLNVNIESLDESINTPYYRWLAPEFVHMCCMNAFRFRYKHAIITDHVCTPGEAYVDFICVDNKIKHTGIGTRLMKWAEQSAEKLECGRIALSVWGADSSCGEFYAMLGYHHSEYKTDYASYLLLQIIFCFSNRFFDFEKSIGQESGRAIQSSRFGFVSEHVMGGSSHKYDAAAGRGNMDSSTRSGSSVSSGGSSSSEGTTWGDRFNIFKRRFGRRYNNLQLHPLHADGSNSSSEIDEESKYAQNGRPAGGVGNGEVSTTGGYSKSNGWENSKDKHQSQSRRGHHVESQTSIKISTSNPILNQMKDHRKVLPPVSNAVKGSSYDESKDINANIQTADRKDARENAKESCPTKDKIDVDAAFSTSLISESSISLTASDISLEANQGISTSTIESVEDTLGHTKAPASMVDSIDVELTEVVEKDANSNIDQSIELQNSFIIISESTQHNMAEGLKPFVRKHLTGLNEE